MASDFADEAYCNIHRESRRRHLRGVAGPAAGTVGPPDLRVLGRHLPYRPPLLPA